MKRGEREKLPDVRQGVNHKFTIFHMTPEGLKELDGYIRTGCYPDGRLGEIFLTLGKPGDENAWADCLCIIISMALQHGMSIDDVFKKLKGQRFIPYGGTSNAEISQCTSILDYVARFILARYSTGTLDEKRAAVDGQ
jgi:ribonucleoside-diphosphate reductase alpha chain